MASIDTYRKIKRYVSLNKKSIRIGAPVNRPSPNGYQPHLYGQHVAMASNHIHLTSIHVAMTPLSSTHVTMTSNTMYMASKHNIITSNHIHPSVLICILDPVPFICHGLPTCYYDVQTHPYCITTCPPTQRIRSLNLLL